MTIHEASKNWTDHGRKDPMWAILSVDAKRGNKWLQEEFFATGRVVVDDILLTIRRENLPLKSGAALDFGCGLGRLSQALAPHFAHVDGVDVSESMIEQANKFNKFENKVKYHLNVATDLNLFPSNHFDFICSLIVLQHIPPAHQLSYITDFMRVLSVGGIAFFQTIHTAGLRACFPNWIVENYRKIKFRGESFIPMYGVKPTSVKAVAQNCNCLVHGHLASPFTGYEQRFASDTFIIRKVSTA